MKLFTFGTLLALVAASADANLIKERLQKFRDPNNVDKSRLVKLVNDRFDRHVEKLSTLLQDGMEQIEGHNNGSRRLEREEHQRLLTKVSNVQRKLDQLKNMNASERAEVAGSDAESRFRMESVDYLDFDA